MRTAASNNLGTLRRSLIVVLIASSVVTTLLATTLVSSHQDPSPPAAGIDPGDITFKDQVVGRTSAARRVIIKNTGGKPLYFDSVSVAGDNPTNFAILKDTCTNVAVEPNRACIVDVTFSPSKTGERNAVLTFADNALDSPQTVKLTGNGINSNDLPPF